MRAYVAICKTRKLDEDALRPRMSDVETEKEHDEAGIAPVEFSAKVETFQMQVE